MNKFILKNKNNFIFFRYFIQESYLFDPLKPVATKDTMKSFQLDLNEVN